MDIIVAYNLKGSKSLQPEIKKIEKKKVGKIQCFYIDSNELTKDETSNKFEKNIDKENKREYNINNKNQIIMLADKYKRINFKKYLENRDKNLELSISRNKKIKSNNFKYFNKNDINLILSNKSKVLEGNEDKDRDKKRQIKLNSLKDESLQKEYSINYYKTIKSSEEDNNNINNKEEEKTHQRNFHIKNILDSDKKEGIINSAKTKMKTYINISKLIKHNIIGSENEIKFKTIEIKKKQNYIINQKNKANKGINMCEKQLNKNKKIIKKNDLEEKKDFEDIPQRRPGCSTEKNMYSIYKKIGYKNDNLNRNKRKKIFDFLSLQQKTTLTKSLKIARTSIKNSEKSKKAKGNLTNNLLKSIIKNIKTQRFNFKTNSKNNKNNIQFINLKDNLSKNSNKIIRCLNFSNIDGNIKNRNDIVNSLKNNSFLLGNQKNSYNQIHNNSVINIFIESLENKIQ